MLTRITRYTLLVLCLLVAGVWGWSYWYLDRLAYWTSPSEGYGVASLGGSIRVYYISATVRPRTPGFDFAHDGVPTNPRRGGPEYVWADILGLILWNNPSATINIGAGWYIEAPLWMLFTPLFPATVAMWYRPIRNRLRGNSDVAFAVEMKQETMQRKTT